MKHSHAISMILLQSCLNCLLMAKQEAKPWLPYSFDHAMEYPLASHPYSLSSEQWELQGQGEFAEGRKHLRLSPTARFRVQIEAHSKIHIQLGEGASLHNLDVVEQHGSVRIQRSLANSSETRWSLPESNQQNAMWIELVHNGLDHDDLLLSIHIEVEHDSHPFQESWFQPLKIKDSQQSMPIMDRYGNRSTIYLPHKARPMKLHVWGTGWLRLEVRAVYNTQDTRGDQHCWLRYYQGGAKPKLLSRSSPLSALESVLGRNKQLMVGQRAISYLELDSSDHTWFFDLSPNCALSADWLAASPAFALPQKDATIAKPLIAELRAIEDRDFHQYTVQTLYRRLRDWDRRQLGYDLAQSAAQYLRQEWLYYQNLLPQQILSDETISSLPFIIYPSDKSPKEFVHKALSAFQWHIDELSRCACIQPVDERTELNYQLPSTDSPGVLRLLLKHRDQRHPSRLQLSVSGSLGRSTHIIELEDKDNPLQAVEESIFHAIEINLPPDSEQISLKRVDSQKPWPILGVQTMLARQADVDWDILTKLEANIDQEQALAIFHELGGQQHQGNLAPMIRNSIARLQAWLNWHHRQIFEQTWYMWSDAPIHQNSGQARHTWQQELANQGHFFLLEKICQLRLHEANDQLAWDAAKECMAQAFDGRDASWKLASLKLEDFQRTGRHTSLLELGQTLEELGEFPAAGLVYLATEQLVTDESSLLTSVRQSLQRIKALQPWQIQQNDQQEDLSRQPVPSKGSPWSATQYEQLLRFPSPLSEQTLTYFRVSPQRPLLLDVDAIHPYQLSFMAHLEFNQEKPSRNLTWLQIHTDEKLQAIPLVSTSLNPDLIGKQGERYSSGQEYYVSLLRSGRIKIESETESLLIRVTGFMESKPAIETAWPVSFSDSSSDPWLYEGLHQLWSMQSHPQKHFQTQAKLMDALYRLPRRNWEQAQAIDILETKSNWQFFRPPQSRAGWYLEELSEWQPEHPSLAAYRQLVPPPAPNYLAVLHGDMQFESLLEITQTSKAKLKVDIFQLYDDGLSEHVIEYSWDGGPWQSRSIEDRKLEIEQPLTPGPRQLAIRFADHRPGRLAYLYLSLQTTSGSEALAQRQKRNWAIARPEMPVNLSFSSPSLLRIHRQLSGRTDVRYQYLDAGEVWSSLADGPEQAAYRFYLMEIRETIPASRLPQLRPTSTAQSGLTIASSNDQVEKQMRPQIISTLAMNRSQSAGISAESQCQQDSEDVSWRICGDDWVQRVHLTQVYKSDRRQHRLQINAYPSSHLLVQGGYRWLQAPLYGNGIGFALDLDGFYGSLDNQGDDFWAASVRPEIFFRQDFGPWEATTQLRLSLRQYNQKLGRESPLPGNAWNSWMEDHNRIAMLTQNLRYQIRADQHASARLIATSNPPDRTQWLDHIALNLGWQKLWHPFLSTSLGFRLRHYFADDLRDQAIWSYGPTARVNWLYGADQHRAWHVYLQVGSGRDFEREQASVALGVETTLGRGLSSLQPLELQALSLPYSGIAQGERYRLYHRRSLN